MNVMNSECCLKILSRTFPSSEGANKNPILLELQVFFYLEPTQGTLLWYKERLTKYLNSAYMVYYIVYDLCHWSVDTDAVISLFVSWFSLFLRECTVKKPGAEFLSWLTFVIVNWSGLNCCGLVLKDSLLSGLTPEVLLSFFFTY